MEIPGHNATPGIFHIQKYYLKSLLVDFQLF